MGIRLVPTDKGGESLSHPWGWGRGRRKTGGDGGEGERGGERGGEEVSFHTRRVAVRRGGREKWGGGIKVPLHMHPGDGRGGEGRQGGDGGGGESQSERLKLRMGVEEVRKR